MQWCIVVVEDEPLIRMDTVEMLEEAGLAVHDFARADEAWAFVEQHGGRVAAIFTNINLPGDMDGIDLPWAVHRSYPTIKTVLTSGGCTSRPGHLPREAEYLQKPWLPLQVLTSMQAATEH